MSAGVRYAKSRQRPPRTVLGPGRCQGCGEEVIYEAYGRVRLGWLHPHGEYECEKAPARTGLSKREYNRLWMRRYRERAA